MALKTRGPATRDLALSDALAEVLTQREQERRATKVPFLDWAKRVPEPKAGRLDFRRFPPQLELYADWPVDDQDGVLMKSTQVGVSTWAIRWALYHADTGRMNGLYIFPTSKDVWDFSDARINPAIRGSEYLSSRMRPDDPDNKGLKRVGLGYVYFRGSESVRGLDSVDGDHMVLDEYDTLNHANLPHAEQRLEGSLFGYTRRVGVPSIPDWGIAKLYERTDKRQWHVRCEGCGDRQPIDFYENVDVERIIRICRRCDRSLEPVMHDGEWVAEHPDRDVRGYHFARLNLPRLNLGSMIERSTDRTASVKQVFWNKDLGLPYAPEEGRLSETALEAATRPDLFMQPGYVGDQLVTMGIDVASVRPLSVRISAHAGDGTKRALFIGSVDAPSDNALHDELDGLMQRYRVNMAVIDHLPEGRFGRTFAERHAGRVYVCSYSDTLKGDVLRVDDEARAVVVRRVDAIDGMMALIRAQRNLLPIDAPTTYRDEMKAPIRIVEAQEEKGKEPKVRYVSTGPDDYAHAEVYDVVATMCWAIRQHVEERTGEQLSTADEHADFDRVELGWARHGEEALDPADDSYDPGFADDEENLNL
jgi:Phage terminase large subunit (GpA)